MVKPQIMYLKGELNRVLIINELKKENLYFDELKEKTNLGESQLNQHLKMLIDNGLIGRKKSGGTWGRPKYKYYFISSCICY